ncbi:unnamed protein product [Parascedosporium putredinis]|uniref:Xylanolytic transcriptional activator regulatory domain-containing protein n=1 Tax=Parascedosporium putredinis TaxID=1442378 RepID=A0A9P1H2W0_9PEZI|nr:unnamed protein product [Parascedosporium putredinis]CAI7995266.1 unnamed protein product [Parascedosporium putredinis]
MPSTDQDSDEGQIHSADDLENENEDIDSVRLGKRKRPLSVSCELCKQRKVQTHSPEPAPSPVPRVIIGAHPALRSLTSPFAPWRQPVVALFSRTGASSNAIVDSRSGSLFRLPDPIHTSQHSDSTVFIQQPKAQGFQLANAAKNLAGQGQSSTVPSLHDGYSIHQTLGGAAPSLPQRNQDYYRTDVKVNPSNLLSSPSDTAIVGSEQELPPYDLLYALVELYFKQIHTWCPILHRKTTMDVFFGQLPLDEPDRVLLHAIVTTTLRFSQDSRLTEENRRHYHDLSKRKVLLYGLDNLSVKSLQALVILALDLCGSTHGPPSWNIMALITRAVVQIGLAVESHSYATIVTAFDFALVETRWYRSGQGAVDAMSEPGLGRPENLGAFAYYIDILSILSQIHLFLKEPVDISTASDVERWQRRYKELDSLLSQWQVGLPAELGNIAYQSAGNKAATCSWVMLQATFHTTIIRLHSSAAYPTMRSALFAPSYAAMQRCQLAVENIAALYEYVVSNGLLDKLGPPFAFSTWVAARLLLVHASTMEHPLSSHIDVFLSALCEMGKHWQVASRYAQLLQRVLDEYQDSERQGDGVTPKSIKILADMRRTAFDLEWLIAHQPRHGAPNSFANHGPGNGVNAEPTRMPSITPARTPAPNELEYFDVFHWFNYPRLPAGGENALYQMTPGIVESGTSGGLADGSAMNRTNGEVNGGIPVTAEYINFGTFAVDASRDWLG